MLVYVRAPFDPEKLSELEALCGQVLYEPWSADGRRYYEEELLEHLHRVQPDALITELDEVTARVLCEYPRLKFIGDCRATPENIDTEACREAGVPLLLTPGRNAQAVAEMLICLVIAALRHVVPSIRWVESGQWLQGTTPYHLWMGEELSGKSIGFVGFGAVPQRTVPLLRAFGCTVSYFDPFVESALGERCSLENLFSRSDIVSLHLPVNEQTRGIVDEHLLRMMKPTSLLVNTSRAAVLRTDHLIKVLRKDLIRGAVLDVLDTEPPTPDDLAIAELPQVLLTPHICGASQQVVLHQSEIMLAAVRFWLKEGRDD